MSYGGWNEFKADALLFQSVTIFRQQDKKALHDHYVDDEVREMHAHSY